MQSYYFHENIFWFQNNKEIENAFFTKKMRCNPKTKI